jgi:hypothetical protein
MVEVLNDFLNSYSRHVGSFRVLGEIGPGAAAFRGGGLRLMIGADGGGRTHTLVRVPDFESSASANSATSAAVNSGCKLAKPHGRAQASCSPPAK